MEQQNAIKKTKDILIKYLRAYLTNYNNYKHLGYDDFSVTDIFDKEPKILRIFPSIIISGSNGAIQTAGLGDVAYELYDDNNCQTGYRYTGMYDLNINIDIGTRSTLDRENLTDLLATAMRVHLRRYIEAEGILIKDVKYGGESEIVYDSDKVYVSTLSISIWSQWYRDELFLPIKDLNLDFNFTNNK